MKKILVLFVSILLVCSCFLVPVSALTSEEVEENEQIIYYSLYTQLSLSEPVICGILSNIYHESGYDPLALGDNGASHGLCQWNEDAGRWQDVVSVCEEYGYDPYSLDGQLFYIYWDLNNTRDDYYTYLLNVEQQASEKNMTPAQVAYEVAYWWCTDYESPAEEEIKGQQRAVYAAEVLVPKYCNVGDGDLNYDPIYGDGSKEIDLKEELEQAIQFVEDLPDWLKWLPYDYLYEFEQYFSLMVLVLIALIALKIAHG